MTRPKPIKSVALLLILALAVPVGLFALNATGPGTRPMLDRAIGKLHTSLVSGTAVDSGQGKNGPPVVEGNWPPIKGEAYPDLILKDQLGKTVRLSDFKGRPILLELAAIPCAGCQAFAGANDLGSFAGVASQSNLDSIHKCAERFSSVRLGKDKNVVFVQLLLYGNAMSSPTSDEVAGWAEHFGMQRSDCNVVLQGEASMLSPEVYKSIPGFHLIDSDFVLQYDSTGHHPEDDLYRDLLPALGTMARERPAPAAPITPGELQSNPFGA
ncbi:peroxiredoxin family protein [Planctomycetes bacterium K23_9]|uniref:Thioredoxin domain-containing protein n=1 Tax=Stieleria marina TaxID=1930275 RepID=A0A517P079_9BACT|nr:hypothetical protein K239x_47910 [Planctomycetes bacterium K23_9]